MSGISKTLGLAVIKAGVKLTPYFSVEGFTRSILKNPIENILGSVFGLSRVTSIIIDKQFESRISVWVWRKKVSW